MKKILVVKIIVSVFLMLSISTASAQPVESLELEAGWGNLEKVKQMLDKGVEINSTNALNSAAGGGHFEIVKLLLEHGADPNHLRDKKYHDKTTPLMDAAGAMQITTAQSTALIKLLLDYGADPHKITVSTALLKSIRLGGVESVKLLLNQGVDVNAHPPYYVSVISPLMQAVRSRDKEIIQLLLSKGADINYKTNQFGTVLIDSMTAQLQDKDSIFLLLLEQGADINAQDIDAQDQYKSVLTKAIIQFKDLEMLKFLITKGADPDVKIKYKDTRNNKTLFKVATGAVNQRDPEGKKKQLMIVEYLSGNGADPDAGSPLHGAIQKGDWELFQVLLKSGADVNARMGGTGGTTPLHMASNGSSHSADMVKLLLEHGANPKAKDSLGRKPIFYARFMRNKTVIGLLLGADPTEKRIIKKKSNAGPSMSIFGRISEITTTDSNAIGDDESDIIVNYTVYKKSATLKKPAIVETDYSNVTVKAQNLRDHNWRSKSLQNYNFSNSSLLHINFDHSNLKGANFYKARLQGVTFINANLENVNFEGITILGMNLLGASLPGANFTGVDLTKNISMSVPKYKDGRRFVSASERTPETNFNGMDFKGANFTNANLKGVSFQNANLEGANFNGANIAKTDFQGANLLNSNFSKTKINHAKSFYEAKLSPELKKEIETKSARLLLHPTESAKIAQKKAMNYLDSFSNASKVSDSRENPGYANSSDKKAIDNSFKTKIEIDMEKKMSSMMQNIMKLAASQNQQAASSANKNGLNVAGNNPYAFMEQYLKQINQQAQGKTNPVKQKANDSAPKYKASHRGKSFAGKRMKLADFSNTDLYNANFRGAILKSSKFNNANLAKANLQATLMDSQFIEANLKEANLSNSTLSRVNFTKAYMEGADLSNSNLPGANFQEANLKGVNFTGANLSGANLEGALPENAKELARILSTASTLYNAKLSRETEELLQSEHPQLFMPKPTRQNKKKTNIKAAPRR